MQPALLVSFRQRPLGWQPDRWASLRALFSRLASSLSVDPHTPSGRSWDRTGSLDLARGANIGTALSALWTASRDSVCRSSAECIAAVDPACEPEPARPLAAALRPARCRPPSRKTPTVSPPNPPGPPAIAPGEASAGVPPSTAARIARRQTFLSCSRFEAFRRAARRTFRFARCFGGHTGAKGARARRSASASARCGGSCAPGIDGQDRRPRGSRAAPMGRAESTGPYSTGP